MRIKRMAAAAVGLMALTVAMPALSAGTRTVFGAFGIDLTGRDATVKPGDDFWSYANGNWAKKTPIPADRGSVGPFVTLSDQAEIDTRTILDDMAADPARYGGTGQQLGDLYASWMDEAALNAKGVAPLKPYLDRIAAARSKQDLEVLFASVGYASPLELGILPDPADPTRYTAAASQGGLGMPSDYYLLPGVKYDGFRTAYRAYVQRIQELAGVPDAAKKADAILALETAMAKVQWKPEEMRDFARIYKPMDRAGMKRLAPEADWDIMLKTAGFDSIPSVMMAGDTAIVALSKMLDTVPVQTWKDWMRYQFISGHAQYLNKAMDDAKFDFYSKTLNDVQQQRDRWKRGVRLVNGAMGEAVGKFYVERFYPLASEAKMQELVANLEAALKDRIEANTWMDPATKQKALAKLAAFEPRIGHPVKYIDYSSIKVDRGDLLGNVIRADEFQHQLELSRLGKPVDRTLWGMTPQTVNAYYNPLMNQITFPAAILQPPFFDPNADPAVNYGAIGAVIGHEIGHGFDDQGSQFGPEGKFASWWTPASRKAFNERTAALIAQYDGYEPLPGVKIKGQLTLGENIGDLNGVVTAYAAYQKYLKEHGPAKVIDGLTGDQRFFLAYAQVWRELQREGDLRQQLVTDQHSPSKYRVNGVVRNVDAWYKAFNIKPGDKLYLPPEQRVRIW